MIVRNGRFGKFLACPNYPKCKSTLPYGEEKKREEKLEGTCPVCGKPAKVLYTRSGRLYYGCSGYPSCKFMSWDEPTGEKCPLCGEAIIKTKKGVLKCSNKDCSYRPPQPEKAPEAPAPEGKAPEAPAPEGKAPEAPEAGEGSA